MTTRYVKSVGVWTAVVLSAPLFDVALIWSTPEEEPIVMAFPTAPWPNCPAKEWADKMLADMPQLEAG